MSASEIPGCKNAPLTRTEASALLRYWLGKGVVCREMKPLEGSICSAVFRLEFEGPPYSAVAKLQTSHQDDPLPRERERIGLSTAAYECTVPSCLPAG